jgi:Uma2 family endonuclease
MNTPFADSGRATHFASSPGWLLGVQQTIVLSDSQPEPDFAIVRGNPRSYLTRHPSAADAGQVIEVADSSLLRDQRDKTRIYARANIPVYWIINLVDQRIEVNPATPSRWCSTGRRSRHLQ